jgi:CubicO group peptidase (beta-lactamase class C family)
MKKITTLLIIVFVSCIGTAQINNAAISKQVDSLMKLNYPIDKPGASIILYKDHSPFFRSSYGMANLEEGEPNNPETIFRIGSITKQFTAIAIMMLLEGQKLSLDETVSSYYPEWFSNKNPITIRQLRSHTK